MPKNTDEPTIISPKAIKMAEDRLSAIQDVEAGAAALKELHKIIDGLDILAPLDDETTGDRIARKDKLIVLAIARIIERTNPQAFDDAMLSRNIENILLEFKSMTDLAHLYAPPVGTSAALEEAAQKIMDVLQKNTDTLNTILRIIPSWYKKLLPQIPHETPEELKAREIDVVHEAIIRILKEKGVDTFADGKIDKIRVAVNNELKSMHEEIKKPYKRLGELSLHSGDDFRNKPFSEWGR